MAPPKRHDSKISPATQARLDASSARLPSCPVERYLATRGAASTSRIGGTSSAKKMTSNQRRFLRAAGGLRGGKHGKLKATVAQSNRKSVQTGKPPIHPRGKLDLKQDRGEKTIDVSPPSLSRSTLDAGEIASAAVEAEVKSLLKGRPAAISRLERERPASLKVGDGSSGKLENVGATSSSAGELDSPSISEFSALSLDTPGKAKSGVSDRNLDFTQSAKKIKESPTRINTGIPFARTAKIKWSEEEDRIAFQAHERHGNNWAKLAKLLPGKTEKEVKTRLNSASRRRWYYKTYGSQRTARRSTDSQQKISPKPVAAARPKMYVFWHVSAHGIDAGCMHSLFSY